MVSTACLLRLKKLSSCCRFTEVSLLVFFCFIVLTAEQKVLYGQITRTGGFHLAPTSIHVNEYLDQVLFVYYYSNEQGVIFKTQGNTNQVKTVSGSNTIGKIYSWSFANASTGWVCGVNGILVTFDTGNTWSRVPSLPQNGAEWRQVHYHSTSHTLFASSAKEGLWSTSSMGATWLKVKNGSFSGVAFKGERGVLTSEQDNRGFYTTNSGQQWESSSDLYAFGPPCYSRSENAFLVIQSDWKICKSANGEHWELAFQLDARPMGPIYSTCSGLYVPAEANSYYYGNLQSGLRRIRNAYTKWDFISCFVNNKMYYLSGTPKLKRYDLSSTWTSKIQLNVHDTLRYYVSKCASEEKTVVIGLDPLPTNEATYTITIDKASPSIEILSPLTGTNFDSIVLRFRNAQLDTIAQTRVTIAVDDCNRGLKHVVIQFIPYYPPVELAVNDIPFGAVSTCTSRSKYIPFENRSCDPMTIESLDLQHPDPAFRIVEPRSLPIVIPPNGKDSIRIDFEPYKLGNLANTLSLVCHVQDTVIKLSSQLTGVGNGTASADLSEDTLEFGTLSRCTPGIMKATVQNTGCEPLKIKHVYLPSISRFEIVSSPEGTWLDPGASATVEIRARLDAPGQFVEELVVVMLDAVNSAIVGRIQCASSVIDAKPGFDVSGPLTVDTLTTCMVFDTVLYLENNSLCDVLNLMEVTVTGPGVMLPNGFTPVVLQPGERTEIRVRIDGAGLTSIAGTISMKTDLFGTLEVPITGSIAEAILAEATLLYDDVRFSTTQCSTVNRSYIVTTHGCGYLPIAGVALRTPDGTRSRFTIHYPSLTPPLHLIEAQDFEIRIEYNPDLPGADTAELIIFDQQQNEYGHLRLEGNVTSTTTTVGLTLQRESASEHTSGESVTASIRSLSAVAQSQQLIEMSTDLLFDEDLLTLDAVQPLSGTLARVKIQGGERLVFSNPTGFALSPDDAVAMLTWTPRIAATSSTTIELQGLVLNEGDSLFARCVMIPQPVNEQASTTLLLDCAETIVQDVLKSELMFRVASIYPQPVNRHDATIEIEAASEMDITLELVDAIGRVVHSSHKFISIGRSSLEIPTTGLPIGTYILRLNNTYGVCSKAIIVE